jgi:hypothetical protein
VLRKRAVKPASLAHDLEKSDVVDLRKMKRSDLSHLRGSRSASFDGFPRAARSLAEAARDHLAAGETTEARRAAEDALLVIDTIADERTHGEVSLVLGGVLLALYEAHRARERFEAAVIAFDELQDRVSAAHSRLGLARAMLMLRDPAARAVMEDAGTIFEELGDDEQVLAIDRALREMEADFESCPTSFHASASIIKAG